MDSWLDPVKTEISLNNGFVLLTIIATKGSTPCTNGDTMYEWRQDCFHEE